MAEELSETRLIADTQQINGDGVDTQQSEARSISNTQQILRAEQALVGSIRCSTNRRRDRHTQRTETRPIVDTQGIGDTIAVLNGQRRDRYSILFQLTSLPTTTPGSNPFDQRLSNRHPDQTFLPSTT